MKKKLLHYLTFASLFAILLISSCKKDTLPDNINNDTVPIVSLDVSESFTWRTNEQVEFNLVFPQNLTDVLVKISSLDESVVWAKGLSEGNVYNRKIVLPTRIKNVKVSVGNNILSPINLNVSSEYVEYTFINNLKSAKIVSQLPWRYSITGTNHSLLVPSNVVFSGVVVSPGDYIGVFYDSLGTLACGGYIEPAYNTSSNMFISAFGVDNGNDGFATGESFTWKIWQASTGNEYTATATYSSGMFTNQGNFVVNGLSGITMLTVTSADADNDGVPDGDDDFPNDPLRAFDNVYPGDGYGTIAFEDLWPAAGDYDFNDLVVNFQNHTIENASNVVHEIILDVVVVANGASFHNGLGIQFPDVLPSWITSVTGYNIQENYISHTNGLENGQSKATIIIFDDAYNVLPYPGDGFIGVNTDPNGTHVNPYSVNITISFDTSLGKTSNDIYASGNPNVFLIVNQTRGREVHLPNYQATDLADPSYFGTFDDDSNGSKTYLTVNNLPWGIETGIGFKHTTEKNSIETAHLKFIPWVQSSGNNFEDWYMDLPNYRNVSYIYDY
ncbi:MAG: LruC domain-containing protein [Bacteroidota bacterium]|nr:LruC domain-containing protein [Bacteroidota bacterium]